MRTLQRLVLALAVVVVACKGKSPEVTPTPGSATAPGSAAGSAASGSAASGSAAPAPTAAAKVFDGPTFTVTSALPGPETTQKDIDTAAGKTTLTMYAFADPADDNSVQMVESNPVPAASGNMTKVLDSAIEGMTENVKAVVDDQHVTEVGSARGFDFTAHFVDEDGEFFMRGRVAFKDGTLYQVVAMGHGTAPTASAEAFVTSFALK